MSERIDTALRLVILIYGAICIYSFATIHIDGLPVSRLIDDITFIKYSTGLPHYSEGYQYIILAILIIFRYVLFGKTYQK